MKIEIIKETKMGEDTWYILEVDGKYIKGSSILQTVVDLYEQIRKEGQDALKTKREILASEQIDVSSNYILNKPL
jgi:hypothetical protein